MSYSAEQFENEKMIQRFLVGPSKRNAGFCLTYLVDPSWKKNKLLRNFMPKTFQWNYKELPTQSSKT